MSTSRNGGVAGSYPPPAAFAFSRLSTIEGYFTSSNVEKESGYSLIERNVPAALLPIDFS